MICQSDVLLMGVSGCGKSSVGRKLADHLGSIFLDADDFHPAANLEKMAAGNPLTDEDRMPWLERIAVELTELRLRDQRFVLACSALKESYRRLLLRAAPSMVIVHLSGTPEMIRKRLSSRHGHFMSTALLDSQFETLEPPVGTLRVGIEEPVDNLVARIQAVLAFKD